MSEPILPDIKNIKSSESYTLPSKGLLYKPEDNIPASITLRRMTTKEDKIRMRNQSEDTIRRDILQACILEKDVDANKLKLMDANYLLFKLRVLSLLDDIYKVGCYCGTCGTEFIHEVELSKVPVKYLTKSVLSKLKVKLPISGSSVDLKFPSLGDIIKTGQDLRDYFEQFPQADKEEAVYTMSSLIFIDKVNGNEMLPEEKEAWLDSMDILDNRAFRDVTNDLDGTYGFTELLEAKCPKCGNIVKHRLPITSELFTPSK